LQTGSSSDPGNNHEDASLVRHAFDSGASGFVLKPYAATELIDAIRTVVKGGIYLSRAIAV
jgi:DNA-binding NarL/FixJ family response regulator